MKARPSLVWLQRIVWAALLVGLAAALLVELTQTQPTVDTQVSPRSVRPTPPIPREQLWNRFRKDPQGAILLARLHWQSLPGSFAEEAARVQMAAAARSAAGTRDAVNARVGEYGIGPKYGSDGFYGPDPDELLFVSCMAEIQKHRGDPPAQRELREIAFDIVTGQRSPGDAFRYVAASGGVSAQEVQALLALQAVSRLEEPIKSLLDKIVLISAAMAVPRELIAEALRELAG